MRYRLLGNSGLRVSEASLGTMTFGDDWGWGSAKGEARKIYDAYCSAEDNLASFDLQLSADQLKALDEASHIDSGFPYSMCAKELVSNFRYGGRRNQIDA